MAFRNKVGTNRCMGIVIVEKKVGTFNFYGREHTANRMVLDDRLFGVCEPNFVRAMPIADFMFEALQTMICGLQ